MSSERENQVEPTRFGLSPEEREHLEPKLENEEKQDIALSLLAFIAVLLLCVLIVITLMIVGSRKLDSSNPENKPWSETIPEPSSR